MIQDQTPQNKQAGPNRETRETGRHTTTTQQGRHRGLPYDDGRTLK